jgi:hypothetical protein
MMRRREGGKLADIDADIEGVEIRQDAGSSAR